MSTTLSFRLPENLSTRLTAIATETERSKSYHLQKALEYYFEEVSDFEIAKDRLHSTEPEIELADVLLELQA
jgi:RHH-type transcriptional regulator, rel operon repressor / antitoxin RelB